MNRIARAALAACAAAVLGAGPAAALESLTGVYQGKLKCSGLVGGGQVKDKDDVEVQVLDLGGLLGLDVSGVGALQGFAATQTSKPERGKVSAVSCLLDAQSLDGSTLHADVQVEAGDPKASLKGTLIRTNGVTGEARICQLRVKRISTAIPNVTGCP
jgi:hypothetical protein